MKIILKKDIENLGFQYEEINVKPGYARNYLIPNGYAYLSTISAKKQLNEFFKQISKKEEIIIKESEKIANELKNIKLKILVKAGNKGKLFGSVNNQTISQALKKHNININKKFIIIPGNNIKILGEHKVKIYLHRKIEVLFLFEIIAEEKNKKNN